MNTRAYNDRENQLIEKIIADLARHKSLGSNPKIEVRDSASELFIDGYIGNIPGSAQVGLFDDAFCTKRTSRINVLDAAAMFHDPYQAKLSVDGYILNARYDRNGKRLG
jgi:hypothetical protein